MLLWRKKVQPILLSCFFFFSCRSNSSSWFATSDVIKIHSFKQLAFKSWQFACVNLPLHQTGWDNNNSDCLARQVRQVYPTALARFLVLRVIGPKSFSRRLGPRINLKYYLASRSITVGSIVISLSFTWLVWRERQSKPSLGMIKSFSLRIWSDRKKIKKYTELTQK